MLPTEGVLSSQGQLLEFETGAEARSAPLGARLQLADDRGQAFHGDVPRIGPKKAAALQQFLANPQEPSYVKP